jgi:putative transposase
MNPKAEKIALFRYGLIAPLVLETLPRGELMRRVRELAAHPYDLPEGRRATFCPATFLDWASRYRQSGFAALAPKPRADRGLHKVVTPQLAELIERLMHENPHRSGTTLLRELALTQGQGTPPLSPTTLYRFLKDHGLTSRQLLTSGTARKKFEVQYANQVWQSDMLFGPYVARPGGGKRQAFLYAILDDASRLIPHAQFYAGQDLHSLLDCLRQAIAARGIPIRLYVDNGHVYRSQQLARIAASLGILIVHTPPYQPEGRGKIERFFRTVREQFLASIDPKQVVTLEDLNLRLWTWIQSTYHRATHSALETTPLARWQRDIEHVRQLPPSTDLRRLFFYRLLRRVRRDSTFMLQKRFYEAPTHLAGHNIEVRFDPLDSAVVDLYFEGTLQGQARPVDSVTNSQIPRDKPPPPSAATSTGINFVELLHDRHQQE